MVTPGGVTLASRFGNPTVVAASGPLLVRGTRKSAGAGINECVLLRGAITYAPPNGRAHGGSLGDIAERTWTGDATKAERASGDSSRRPLGQSCVVNPVLLTGRLQSSNALFSSR